MTRAAVRGARKPKVRARTTPKTTRKVQYAALPWRKAKGKLQILLITTRNTRRWIIPKGWPIVGYTPAACAGYEALEEAGVAGEITPKKIGTFSYQKQHKTGAASRCVVQVFALKVTRRHRKWPEKDARESCWYTPEEAAALVKESGLRRLIVRFAEKRAKRA
jgi:ADP-ribose pyrophosphatase YjhB (NUDIX family)